MIITFNDDLLEEDIKIYTKSDQCARDAIMGIALSSKSLRSYVCYCGNFIYGGDFRELLSDLNKKELGVGLECKNCLDLAYKKTRPFA